MIIEYFIEVLKSIDLSQHKEYDEADGITFKKEKQEWQRLECHILYEEQPLFLIGFIYNTFYIFKKATLSINFLLLSARD